MDVIVDLIQNAAQYAPAGSPLARALALLASGEWRDKPAGRYEIDGARAYATVQAYEPAPAGAKKFEAHRKYLDVQALLSGEEEIAYAPCCALAPAAPYDAGRDCAFYTGAGSAVRMRPGMFMILYPQDAHMPGIACGEGAVRKVVVKVALDAAE